MAAEQMNASPMRASSLHDQFVLLDGTTKLILPGFARVTGGLSSSTDAMAVPGEGEEVAQVSEAAGEIKVSLTMTTDDQWRAYQNVLMRLRKGTQEGPAVFTCTHPEARARRIKRLYFQSESQDGPYSAREGYRVTLSFSENLKKKQQVQSVGGVPAGVSPTFDPGGKPSEAEGQVAASAVKNLPPFPPGKTRSGVSTAFPGYCSGWAWRAWTDARGMGDNRLFGSTAAETESLFRAAGQRIPWSLSAQQALRPGDAVFYPPTKSVPQGHIGIFVGVQNGVPMVAGNNYLSYQKRGGVFVNGKATGYDRQGRPVDARGVEPMMSLGTPSGIGKPEKIAAGAKPQGPAAPLPSGRPSQDTPKPR